MTTNNFLFAALASLSLLSGTHAQNASIITSDTYFYGQSPPVYPTPIGDGSGWEAAYAKAVAFVGQLTPAEKWNLTAGMRGNNICSGNINAIPRLNFPGLCVSDAGNGLRSTDFVSGFPSALHVGASWNKSSAHERAKEMGLEFYKKGVNVLLGPVVGPIGSIAEAGRNWEGFTNDPYLNGGLVYETVVGIQESGVSACTKHFIGNEQETNRNPGRNAQNITVEAVSSNIDDKTIHELYAWPFAEAVRAGTDSIMCSYNRINNSYACQNSYTQNGILKTEMGFQGFIMSDWGAVHAGVATAEAGLDMMMPSYPYGYGNLTAQWTNGTLPMSRLDDQATRIMTAYFARGQDQGGFVPGRGMQTIAAPHQAVIGKSPSSKSVLLTGAQEGYVLVKNVNNALPLKRPNLISIFGYAAVDVTVNDFARLSFGSSQPNQSIPGLLYVGGGSGANNPAYISDYICAFGDRAYEYGTSILWDTVNVNPTVDQASDVCIVAINAYATEGWDRMGLHDDYSDSIVLNVANKCANTVVVIQNAGIRLVDTFYNHPNISAIIYAHLPGQDAGRALTSLMYGDVSFSGKLPYTVARNETDYGPLLSPVQPEGQYVRFPQDDFSEGVYIDYKAFDAQNISPRFEFGYGLTYSTFSLTNLTASVLPNAALTPYPAPAKILPGGNPNLFSTLFTVSTTLTNTGSVTAAEVAQLYVGIPGGPIKQLRGFEKVLLAPGASAVVTFALTRKDLSTWDVTAQEWLLQAGTYKVYVGNSSRNLPLAADLVISAVGGGGGGSGSSTLSTVTRTSSVDGSGTASSGSGSSATGSVSGSASVSGPASPSSTKVAPWPPAGSHSSWAASWNCPSNGNAGWGWGQGGGSGVTGGHALRAGSGWKKGW